MRRLLNKVPQRTSTLVGLLPRTAGAQLGNLSPAFSYGEHRFGLSGDNTVSTVVRTPLVFYSTATVNAERERLQDFYKLKNSAASHLRENRFKDATPLFETALSVA